MRINSAAVALFFLIAIASQGSISCDFFGKIQQFISDGRRTAANDDDIFGVDPICQKLFNKVFNFFSGIFPIPYGAGGGVGSSTKRPGSSINAGSAVSAGGMRPPIGGNGAGSIAVSTDGSVRPPGAVGGVITGPLVPVVVVRPPGDVGGVITGPLVPVVGVRPPGAVGGAITGPLAPVVGERPPGDVGGVIPGPLAPVVSVPPAAVGAGIITGPLVPIGSGAASKPPTSVAGPIIPTGPLRPTGGLDADTDDTDGIITIENDYPEIDYDAAVERGNT